MQIVVPSTTHYSDCWHPFMALFRKFWTDCQFPVTLITDTQTDPWEGDEAIVMGQDYGWCKNFLLGLEKVDSEFVLMMQEDFFLNYPVDKAFVMKALKILLDEDRADCFRLYPCPGPEIPIGEDYGLIKAGAPYRVSCQSAIWRKSALMDICSRFDKPGQFEMNGTEYVNMNKADRYYFSVMREPNAWPLQYYCTAIVKGEWNPGAVEFVKKQGIPIDTSRRPIMRELA